MNCPTLPEALQHYWSSPSPHWGTGIDPRSSQAGLLSLFYASLERASHYQWLNAGRTLIDKTYLTILSQVQQCSMLGVAPTELASRLDSFIRGELVERWIDLDDLGHEERHDLAHQLHRVANEMLFRGEASGQATTSQILFFLIPQLPFFPMPADRTDYPAWHRECRQLFGQYLPRLAAPALPGVYGDAKTLSYVAQALGRGDWWQRWQFINRADA